MKLIALPLFLMTLFFTSCKEQLAQDIDLDPEESYLPMQIGNYWKMNDQNYTEIQDTVRIAKKLYYKFYSLVGGDASLMEYLRIDENNQLIGADPAQPGFSYLHAKFNAKVGDTFFTLNDKSWNDNQVKLINDQDDKMTFEYDMVYHPNLKGHPHTKTFIKGKGYSGDWKSVRINAIIY